MREGKIGLHIEIDEAILKDFKVAVVRTHARLRGALQDEIVKAIEGRTKKLENELETKSP